MSKLSDIKLLNKSISQGSIYQINKKNTLGSFTTLEGVSKEPSHTSIESFLPNGSHTDAADSRVQDVNGDARYENLSLDELYEIYSEKIRILDQSLNDFEPLAGSTPVPGDSSSEYTLYKATNGGGTHYFSNDGGATISAIPYLDSLTTETTTSPNDWMQDSTNDLSDTTTTDQVLLTCNNMPTTDNDNSSLSGSISKLITASIDQATDDQIKAGICNPYTNSTDAAKYEDIINLIAQLNEIAEQMKIKMDANSDTSIGMIADVTENLDYYTSRFEYMLKYKVRFSDITDVNTPPSSISDNSSGYLEIEGLKFESAQLLYMSLLLGTLVAGAVTVGAIIKSNKQ